MITVEEEVKIKEYLRSVFRLSVLFFTLWHFGELKVVDYKNAVKKYKFGYYSNKKPCSKDYCDAGVCKFISALFIPQFICSKNFRS
jgi:hypothetical protein